MQNMITLRGKVKKGESRGKDLGFPTANIDVNKTLEEGIYISSVKLKNKTYGALTFIGKAITFNETKLQAETYILDFNQDIYNNWISITLILKIRENKKFDNINELIKEMRNDEKIARKYFKNV